MTSGVQARAPAMSENLDFRSFFRPQKCPQIWDVDIVRVLATVVEKKRFFAQKTRQGPNYKMSIGSWRLYTTFPLIWGRKKKCR